MKRHLSKTYACMSHVWTKPNVDNGIVCHSCDLRIQILRPTGRYPKHAPKAGRVEFFQEEEMQKKMIGLPESLDEQVVTGSDVDDGFDTAHMNHPLHVPRCHRFLDRASEEPAM